MAPLFKSLEYQRSHNTTLLLLNMSTFISECGFKQSAP
jgi:hypothetical protein